ncbi:MAG: RelA/SpoT domain protein [Clostridiales bacterium]|nr:RelA/SpoT domain protein [Clostridiales bacterium]
MTFEDFYGENYSKMKQAEQCLLDLANAFPGQKKLEGIEPIIYCTSRIKSPDSMIRKLETRELPVNCRTALTEIYDAVGIRVICSFVDDVYDVYDWLCAQDLFRIIQKKDYISHPKPNGYRSLHLILQFTKCATEGMYAEIQLRTIAIDFWAALEHQLKYKHTIKHEAAIKSELKRCADEIASVDMSMQSLRDIIREEGFMGSAPGKYN